MNPKFDQSPTALSQEQINQAVIEMLTLVDSNVSEITESGVLKIELKNFPGGPLATFAQGIRGYVGGIQMLIESLKEAGFSAKEVYSKTNPTEVEFFEVRPIFKEEV
ncbi:MAG: hypothetical protein Q7S34_00465 [bacterium]|nr:hypothetical protein [bacterium]